MRRGHFVNRGAPVQDGQEMARPDRPALLDDLLGDLGRCPVMNSLSLIVKPPAGGGASGTLCFSLESWATKLFSRSDTAAA